VTGTTDPRPPFRRLTWAPIVGGIAGLGLSLWLLKSYGWRRIGDLMGHAGWTGLLALTAFHGVQVLCSAAGWHAIAGSPVPRQPLRAYVILRWIREAVNNLLPLAQVGGEVVVWRLLRRRGTTSVNAIAATLAGENNPSGRLPVTFYANTGQLPDFHNYSMERRTYRYFTDKPIYGFGFGLSYSTFRYTGLELSNGLLSEGKEIEATLRVKNTSSRAGDEVVELYLTPPDSPTTPVRKLIGFTRIHLDAGEEKPVSFHIPSDMAMTVAEDGTPALLSGRYKVFAGDGQPGEASAFQQATFEVP